MRFIIMKRRNSHRVATGKKGEMSVDWTELPPELVESISKLLHIYTDYLRFRSVCHTWRYSVPKTPLHLPHQLPWLMLSHRAFFDLSLNKTHILNLSPQPSHRTRICGSSHGWLITLNETPQIRLHNPLTRATRYLPPLHSFPNVVAFSYAKLGREYLIRNPYGGIYAFNPVQMCNSYIRKVVLSASPTRNEEFAAFAIVGPSHYLAFCRNGYDSWVFVNQGEKELYYWEDVVDYKGMFYAVSKEGDVAVCDFNNEGWSSPRFSVIHPETPYGFGGDIHYAVFSAGDMMLVTRVLEHGFSVDAEESSNLVYKTVGFEVFKMNWGMLTWQRVKTLGDRVLFVGGNSSLSLCASEFVGCYSDCVYFTDDYSELNDKDACGKHDLGIFRFRDKSVEPLPCFPSSSCSRLGWPLPIWVSPNPC